VRKDRDGECEIEGGIGVGKRRLVGAESTARVVVAVFEVEEIELNVSSDPADVIARPLDRSAVDVEATVAALREVWFAREFLRESAAPHPMSSTLSPFFSPPRNLK
jgi:hypothetical protein